MKMPLSTLATLVELGEAQVLALVAAGLDDLALDGQAGVGGQ